MSVSFRVHVRGDLGGTIERNHDPFSIGEPDAGRVTLPHDACGLRWNHPWAYYWYDTAPENTVDALPISDNPAGSLSFTGPYARCAGAIYEFEPPLVQNGVDPAELATTLVVQVGSISDVELLDSNGNVIEFGGGGGVEPLDLDIAIEPPDIDFVQGQLVASAIVFREIVLVRVALGHLIALSCLVGEVGLRGAPPSVCQRLLDAAVDRLRHAIKLGRQLEEHVQYADITKLEQRSCRERETVRLMAVRLKLSAIILNRIQTRLDRPCDSVEDRIRRDLDQLRVDAERSLATLREISDDLSALQYIFS